MSRVLRGAFNTASRLAQQRVNNPDPQDILDRLTSIPDQNYSRPDSEGRTDDRGNIIPPVQDIPSRINIRTKLALEALEQADFHNKKAEALRSSVTRFALSPLGRNISNNLQAKLLISDSPSANFIASFLLEDPSGKMRFGDTASALEDAYRLRLLSKLVPFTEQLIPMYARLTQGTRKVSAFGKTLRFGAKPETIKRLSYLVRQELNYRSHNQNEPSLLPDDPQSKEYKEAYLVHQATDIIESFNHEAWLIQTGKDQESGEVRLPVDGFEEARRIPGYFPHRFSGIKMQDYIKQGQVTKKDLVHAMTRGLLESEYFKALFSEHLPNPAVFRNIAEQIGNTIIIKTLRSTTSSAEYRETSFLDSSQDLLKHMEEAGIDQKVINLVKKTFETRALEQQKIPHAKLWTGMNYDQVIPGTDLTLLDFFEDDILFTLNRYARQASGASALARFGLKNFSEVDDLIAAVSSEQRRLGETPIPEDAITAMMSHFKGGPIEGYIAGHRNQGITEYTGFVKKLTNLAFLNRLGFAQAAETGALIAQVGTKRFYDQALKGRKMNPVVLKELAFLFGDIGKDHKVLMDHYMVDELNDQDAKDFISKANRFAGKMVYYQGYLSLFFQVRQWQQKVFFGAFTNKIFLGLKNNTLTSSEYLRLRQDTGLTLESVQELKFLFQEGIIETDFHKGIEFLTRLNTHQWSPELRQNFTSSWSRAKNQVIQAPLAGEQDPWIHSEVGSILTHLKSFTMLSYTKQFLRNIKFKDQQTITLITAGLITAYLSFLIRDLLEGKEVDHGELTMKAISYGNSSSWLPMVTDPLLTIMGLDQYKISSHPSSDPIDIPSITYLNRAIKVPGSLADMLTGSGDSQDKSNIQTLPYLSMIGSGRLFSDSLEGRR